VFEAVVPDRFKTGESPVWDELGQRICWVSIDDGDIHALDSIAGQRWRWNFPSVVTAFGFTRRRRVVAALRDRVVLFDPATGESVTLADIPMPIEQSRLNDGKVGPDGAFWVGSMDTRTEKEPLGKLYRVAPDGSVRIVVDDIKVSNGLAWSPDGRTMYFADTRGYWIDAWDFDPDTGAMSNRRRFVDCTDETGRPDGATVDDAGNYWSARPSVAEIACHSPRGDLLQRIAMPNYRPTMPCFGGRDRTTLYVTSLSVGVSEDALKTHPLCGTIVSAKVRASGPAGHLFAD
jgi:sugar lactone lactonase YvrE